MWTCWAAALEAWLAVTPGRKKWLQVDLVGAYATDDNGGLDPKSGWPNIADDFKMDYEVVAGSDLDAQYFVSKLRNHGHVLVGYNLAKGIAHVEVVYGAGYPDGKNFRIAVMDPDGARFRNRPITYFTKRAAVMVSWPR